MLMENELILRGENLKKVYKKRTVVNNVSVSVKQGEVVGLLGPNGAGKTTTFYMIVGMIKPNGGKVYLENSEITHEPMYKRAKMGIGYLPQEASVFRRMSVEDNIMAILQMIDLTNQQRKEKQEQLLEELGITHVRKSQGYQLSGGERRRCEIARALSTNPKFILLDEPFAGVDPIAVEDIMKIVASLKNKGIGILITDHNVHETLSIVDRGYILINGQIFKEGTANFLAEDQEVRKLYLGENFKLDRY
jgi:lipopolysaccharide export system ATP-binding protein